jgi:rhodanese-related sulfurtransferase
VNEVSVEELKAWRDAGRALVLLDVREPDEIETAAVAGAVTIPMRDVPAHVGELPTEIPIVVMCHHGGRSANVTGFLNANGRPNAVNLDGGIEAWSLKIDPTVPRY